MKQNNFFNFKERNMWDIGWPCSPRYIVIILGIPLLLFFGYLITLNNMN